MSLPVLRFQQDDGQDFPEFETKKLSDLAKVYDGTHMTPDYKESGVPFYSVEHVTNNNFRDTKFISEEIFEKENKRVTLEKSDILMTRIGDIGTAKYISWDVRASFYVSLALIKKSHKINPLYLSHYISAPYFQRELHERTIHVAFPKKINLGEIGECFVKFPCEREQSKVANFLTAVDEKITQLTQKHDLLTRYKKGVMQQIFIQELRFKDDGGGDFPEWQELELGDAAEILMGQSPDSNSYNDEEKGVPLVQGNADITNRRTNPRAWTTAPTKQCVPNDIILTVRAPVGAVAISDHIACIGRGVCAIRNNDKAVSNYIYQLLLWYEPTKWNSLEQGSTFTAVSGKDIKTIDIPLPTLKEQTKIANFLTAIDDKISTTKAQLEAVKQYKQGLLQQMFV